jgi:sulfate transport system substrate-binding protein
VTVDDAFGGWKNVQTDHLAEGALLNQIHAGR